MTKPKQWAPVVESDRRVARTILSRFLAGEHLSHIDTDYFTVEETESGEIEHYLRWAINDAMKRAGRRNGHLLSYQWTLIACLTQ